MGILGILRFNIALAVSAITGRNEPFVIDNRVHIKSLCSIIRGAETRAQANTHACHNVAASVDIVYSLGRRISCGSACKTGLKTQRPRATLNQTYYTSAKTL